MSQQVFKVTVSKQLKLQNNSCYSFSSEVTNNLKNINVKNDFFGFPKVKWLHVTSEVDICVRCSCQIFSGFHEPKSIKIDQFLTELFKK